MTLARPILYPYPCPEPYASSTKPSATLASPSFGDASRSRIKSVSIYPSPPLWLGQIPPRLRSHSQRIPTASTSTSKSTPLSLSVSPPAPIRQDAISLSHRLSDTQLITSPSSPLPSPPSSPTKYTLDTAEISNEMRSSVGAMNIGLGLGSGGVVKKKKLARHRMMYLLGESVDEYGNIVTDSTRFEKRDEASARRVSSKEREKNRGMAGEEGKRSSSREKDAGQNVRVYTLAIPESPEAGNGMELPLEEGERTPRPGSKARANSFTWTKDATTEQTGATTPLITPPYSDGDDAPCPIQCHAATPTSISPPRGTYLNRDCSVVTPPSSFDSNYDDDSFDSSSDEEDVPSHLRWSIRRLSGIKSNVSLLQRQRQVQGLGRRTDFSLAEPRRDIEQSSRLWEESRKLRVDVQLREREIIRREEKKVVRFKMFVAEDDREEWTEHQNRNKAALRGLLVDQEECEVKRRASSSMVSSVRRRLVETAFTAAACPLSEPSHPILPLTPSQPSAPLTRKLPLDPNVWLDKQLDAYIPYLAYKDTDAFASFIGRGTHSSPEIEGDLRSVKDLSSVQFTRFNIPPEEYISDDPLPIGHETEEIEEPDYFIPKPPPRKRSDCDLLRKRVLEWNMVRCGKANGVRTRGEKEPRIHAFCDVTCRTTLQEINLLEVTVVIESGRFARGLRRVRSAKWSDLGVTMDKAMKASFGASNEIVMDRWKDRMDRGYDFGYGIV